MKNTLFLHIGFHKTGTSSIQFYLNSNRPALKRNGLMYPKSVLNGNNHSILANSLKSIYKENGTNPHYEKLRKEIKNYPGDVIVSSECFMEGLNPDAIKDSLIDFNRNIKIVIYVRPQIQWIESLYGEVIKDSSRRYTGRIEYIREVRNGVLNFFDVVKRWQNTFGEGNVIVREFKKWKNKDDLIRDFFTAINHSSPKLSDDNQHTAVKNPAFDPRCLEFLRRINMIAMPREMHIQMVSELGALSQNISTALGKNTIRLITRNDIQRLEEKWDQNIGHPNSQILSTGNALPFNNESPLNFPEKNCRLSVTEEFWIFDHLSKALQDHISKMSASVRNRCQGETFIPVPPENEEARLRVMVGRLRAELNWIYA